MAEALAEAVLAGGEPPQILVEGEVEEEVVLAEGEPPQILVV